MLSVTAVNILLTAQDIISVMTAEYKLHATVISKLTSDTVKTEAHVHLSLTSVNKHEVFYTEVLQHLQAITVFIYSNFTSYERAVDSV